MQLMKDRRLDTVGLCETKLSEEGTKIIHDNQNMVYKGGKDTGHGVGFMVTKEMSERVRHINFGEERILYLVY